MLGWLKVGVDLNSGLTSNKCNDNYYVQSSGTFGVSPHGDSRR